MADGDRKSKPLPPPLVPEAPGDEPLVALFGGLHDERERHAIAHPSGHLGEKMHPSRARAARAGMPIGRLVPSSDFTKRQTMKTEGVPSIGLAPPRQVEQGVAPPVQQMRQLTGMPPNSRSNSTIWDLSSTVGADVPLIQFNGQVDDTDMLTVMLGVRYLSHFPDLSTVNGNLLTNFKALVTWGVGNASLTAEIDFKQGTILNLPANFLSITARCPASNQLNNPPALPKVLLTCACAYGTVPSHAQNRATLTSDEITLAHGVSSSALAVPNFAQGIGIINNGTLGTRLDVVFEQVPSIGSNTIGIFGYTNDTNAANQGANIFPVPNGAPFVVFTNRDNAATVSFKPIWELAF